MPSNYTLSPEAVAELTALSDLATGLSDGLKVLTARNLARPINLYAEVEPLPSALVDAEAYTDRFLDWQLDRAPKAQKEQWTSVEVASDAALYIRRRIMGAKMEGGLIEHPIVAALAVQNELGRRFRNAAHEAINHAAKHNDDIKALGRDIHDSVDEALKLTLQTSMQKLAGAALTTIPELQVIMLSHKPESEDV